VPLHWSSTNLRKGSNVKSDKKDQG